MGKFVFDSSHVYEYAFYINDQLIIATNDDNFGLDGSVPNSVYTEFGTLPYLVELRIW